MLEHNVSQGSPEWLALRANYFTASEAPAMMGRSPYMSRSELLRQKATGIAPEIDAATQSRFDDGHRFEALARGLAEQIIGEDLYPITGSEGNLLASFDGLTMLGDTAFEHKTLNDSLRYAPWDEGNGDHLPLHYRVQMEQQLMVSGAERVLFVASRWSDAGELIEERHCWYSGDLELRAQIIAGWEQFEKDLAAWTPSDAADPAPTGKAPETLPALRIEISGAVTASNLAEFKQTALAAIGAVNRDLKTDQDFADADRAVKWCADVESRLAAAKEHALSQTASIDELFRTIDDISAEARRVRLDLDKLVKARKESIRGEIVAEGAAALKRYVAELNAAMPDDYLPAPAADFAGAIKGKRTIESLRDAVDTELARAKIAASQTASRIHANLSHAAAHIKLHQLPDLATLVLKQPDDFAAIVQQRLAEQAQREAQERERIRAEEQAAARAEVARAEAMRVAQEVQRQSEARAQAVIPGETIRLGEVNALLAPVSITAAGLTELGFSSCGRDRAAVLYRASDLQPILSAIAGHITQRAAAPGGLI